LGETRKAIEYYEQRLEITREIGDRRGEGNGLFNLGLALHTLEEKDRAVGLMQRALAIYEAIESPSAKDARDTSKEWGALPG
jgi:tetratricopeptide (TPR) repeat protein